MNSSAPLNLAHRYNEKLAAALGVEVEKTIMEPNWHIRQGGRAPKIENIVDRVDAWAKVIEWFIFELRRCLAQDAPS